MSVVSAKSIANRCRAIVSYVLSCFGIVHVRHLPVFVSVEPANVCQLHCPQCPVGGAHSHHSKSKTQNSLLSLEAFRRIVEQITPCADTLILYFQGEPLLNKDLPQMIREARERGLYTVLSTNGQAMTADLAQQLVQAGVNRVIVSVDGLSQETYEQYRVGGDVHKALAAITYLHDAKRACHSHNSKLIAQSSKLIAQSSKLIAPLIEMQCLRLSSNEHEWATMRRSYRKIGADILTLKTAQFYDYEHGNELMPTNPRYCRYVQGQDGVYRPKNRPLKEKMVHRQLSNGKCYRLWSGCVIDVEGNVRPCCFDKEGKYIFGNVFTQSLQDIWYGEKANAFRQMVLQHRDTIDICTNCTTK